MLTINASIQQDTIALDHKEFFFLAGILGSNHLLGVEDPFQGYLAEEIAEEWEITKHALLSKGYLIQEKDSGMLTMPPAIFSRVAVAGLAERACWLKYTQGEETFEGYLHVTDERVVQVCRCKDNASCFKLVELGTVEEACHVLVNDMKLQEGAPSDVPALLMPKSKFNEIFEIAPKLDIDAVSDFLAKETNDMEGSVALARCLRYRTCAGEMHLSTWNGQEWETQNAAFIANDSMNWLLRMSSCGEHDWLTASLTGKEQFQEMLLMWLRQPAATN